ncbi:MAG TPA: hypothetical protein VGH34_07300 [Vicinamibacterales bacterium]
MKPESGGKSARRKTGGDRHTAAAPVLAETREVYLSLASRPAVSATTAVFFGGHRVSGGRASSGIASSAAPAIASTPVLLPAGLTGLDIHEPLHRFDANLHPPTLEGGVSSANRVGETIALLTMKWRLVPDGFETSPETPLTATELHETSSQRFAMVDGGVTFQDRGRSAIRFFGAGRTYPATTDGQPRLLFAGSATIIDGTGSLTGARGTLTISGEVTAPSLVALTVTGRLDTTAASFDDTLEPLLELSGHGAPATVLNLLGESAAGGLERVSMVRVSNDLGNGSRLRSLCRIGLRVGHVHGPLAFDPDDLRAAHELPGASRTIIFTDPAGRPIGGITAGRLEGTAFSEQRDGRTVNRLSAYGPATGGTGALTGAGGVLTLDTTVDADGSTRTLYSLRLADPGGRFRAVDADTYRAPRTQTADRPIEPAPAATLRFADAFASAVTHLDRAILRRVERTLADGVALARWWEEKDRADDYTERFDVVRDFADAGRSFGFFETAVVGNADLPVMGIVQDTFFDRQKMASGETIRDQMREFIFRYFLRVSHLYQPEPATEAEPVPLGRLQRVLSWLPEENERRVGSGCEQLYYKRRDSGEVGKFVGDERSAVVDLRDIGTVYDWILIKVDVFDFGLSFAPFGSEAPKLQMPMKDPTYVVIGPPFIKNQENPEPGVLGQYGFGYAFVPYSPDGPGVIAYGPGHFTAAIQNVDFTVVSDGEIRVRTAFVVNRPDKIAQVDIDPIDWSFRFADMMTFGIASRLMAPVRTVTDTLPLRVSGLDPISTYIWVANTVTGGMAATRLGYSKSVLEKRMLVQHFLQNYEMLRSSVLVWRTVPDWTDHAMLPAFCRT